LDTMSVSTEKTSPTTNQLSPKGVEIKKRFYYLLHIFFFWLIIVLIFFLFHQLCYSNDPGRSTWNWPKCFTNSMGWMGSTSWIDNSLGRIWCYSSLGSHWRSWGEKIESYRPCYTRMMERRRKKQFCFIVYI